MDAFSDKPTVLHVLSQRPSRTGSGVTLDSLVRCAQTAGYQQFAVVGTPRDDRQPDVGELDTDHVFPLVFGADVPLDLPGMSDVMPYPSRRFSSLSPAEITRYKHAWQSHLERVIQRVEPDVIHSHHIWLLSALIKDVAPQIPVVTHCHATGLRQMTLCPHLEMQVRTGCRRNDAFCVLHAEHAEELRAALDIEPSLIHTVAAGYREDLFHTMDQDDRAPGTFVYAGKFSHAKGLPWLLDAIEVVAVTTPHVKLHVAGTGSGEEAEALRARMESMPQVQMHGMLSQSELGKLLRRSRAFVLPSMYEGLPLVLVEAAACGCRVICTELPGVVRELKGELGDMLTLVSLPSMQTIDQPDPASLPRFVADLAQAIAHVAEQPSPAPSLGLQRFTWQTVFESVERIWLDVIRSSHR